MKKSGTADYIMTRMYQLKHQFHCYRGWIKEAAVLALIRHLFLQENCRREIRGIRFQPHCNTPWMRNMMWSSWEPDSQWVAETYYKLYIPHNDEVGLFAGPYTYPVGLPSLYYINWCWGVIVLLRRKHFFVNRCCAIINRAYCCWRILRTGVILFHTNIRTNPAYCAMIG